MLKRALVGYGLGEVLLAFVALCFTFILKEQPPACALIPVTSTFFYYLLVSPVSWRFTRPRGF